ncbi:MAG: hypothetical protein Q4B47_04220 [Eubacteriales bacterium]|nr:hypothetical protein [Eubacteriales bacterium]
MAIKQISVFVENKTGSMVECTSLLAKAGIDLKAMSIAEEQEFGILRLIASDTYTAVTTLKDAGYVVNVKDVVVAEMIDQPGGAGDIIALLAENNISIKYMYAFAGKKSANLILRVDDPAKCENLLKQKGIKLIQESI